MNFKSSRIITLSVGSQTLRLAQFQRQPEGGIILLDYRSRELLIDPERDRVRRPQISATLLDMMTELGIKSEAVSYAVPTQSVFTRFVKLPVVEEEKVDGIVAFEAQQNLPFPIEEVVWDHQIIGSAGSEEIQVALVAIKVDVLEEINSAVEKTGLRTTVVDVATGALCNAFRHNYGELSGCSLLVDIGARTTNFLFIEPRKIFSRSIPIGGASVTAAIAKEFGEPFEAAEFRKKRDAFLGLDRPFDSSDPDVSRASKLMRMTLTRLYAELMRSISYYRAQRQGLAPARVFLCGGMATAANIREFFGEKLRLPVGYLNPLRNVAVGSALVPEITDSASLLGELVGLALRSIGECSMSFNLRPAVVKRRHELERRRPFFVTAASSVLLAILGWGFYYLSASQVISANTENLKAMNAPMLLTEANIGRLRLEAAKLDAISLPVVAAINDRFFWPQILEELNVRLPTQDIWITELVPTCGGKPVGFDAKSAAEGLPEASSHRPSGNGTVIDGLLLRGLYLCNAKQQEVVVDYFKNLVGSPLFKVDPHNRTRVIKSTIPDNDKWAFPYELQLELKKPLQIP